MFRKFKHSFGQVTVMRRYFRGVSSAATAATLLVIFRMFNDPTIMNIIAIVLAIALLITAYIAEIAFDAYQYKPSKKVS